jgi:hypothetical protein
MTYILILLFLSPVLPCIINAALNRREGAHPHRTPFTTGVYANMVLIPIYFILHVNVFGTRLPPVLFGLVFFIVYLNCAVFLNWFIFTLTDVSMHIQLMFQIESEGAITEDNLIGRYNKEVILGNRIPRLLELGQLRIENERLYINGQAVLIGASICCLIRRILGIPVRPEQAVHD